MRRLALVIFLACALSGGARGGEIHPTGVIEPPPPTTATTTGEIHTTDEIPTTGTPDPQASSTVLTMILTLISIVR